MFLAFVIAFLVCVFIFDNLVVFAIVFFGVLAYNNIEDNKRDAGPVDHLQLEQLAKDCPGSMLPREPLLLTHKAAENALSACRSAVSLAQTPEGAKFLALSASAPASAPLKP